ncbi:MAG: protein kinase [Candidatus Riflebacteria bacterium]|nr:protein kinase [Candidatus Riflebacteria bacterium]
MDQPHAGSALPRFSPEFLTRYRPVRLLGEGGMGAVYLAHQLELDRPVAIKTLKGFGREEAARFAREGQVLSSLRHPRIVKVLDAGVDAGIPYLVCELIEGETLENALETTVFTLSRALETTAAVADALAYAHDRGIVHRDVKPANIFLVGSDVKLADFGLARGVGVGQTVTQPGFILGTPEYMAPEQIEGSEVSAASDQYALGVLCYRIIAGCTPHPGRDAAAIMTRRLASAPIPLSGPCPGVPAAVETAVMLALARSPANRHRSVSAFGQELLSIARGLGPAGDRPVMEPGTPFPSAKAAPARPRSRRPVRTAIAPAGPSRPAGQPPAERTTAITPTRDRRGLLLAACVLLAGACTVALVMRAPGPEVRPAVTPSPLLQLLQPRFEIHRSMRVPFRGELPEGVRFELRCRGEPPRRGRVTTATNEIAFDDLLPETNGIVSVTDESSRPAGPTLAVSTPAIAPVRDLTIVPSYRSALVHFFIPREAELMVRVREAEPGHPSKTQTARSTSTLFHRVFAGLAGDREYELRVNTPAGWGGIAPRRFRTLARARQADTARWLAAVQSPADRPLLDPWTDQDGSRNPDVVPHLLAWLRARKRLEHQAFEVLARLARDLRDRELVGALVPHVGDSVARLRCLAEAAADARHERAFDLGRRLQDRVTLDQDLEPALWALSATPGRKTCDLVGQLLERHPSFSWSSPAIWMLEADQTCAREWFDRWLTLTGGPMNPLAPFAIEGLAASGAAGDVQTLIRFLGNAQTPTLARLAATALAMVGTAEAVGALRGALVPGPRARELIWALVQAGVPEAGREIAPFLPCREPLLRRDATLAMGHLGCVEQVAAIRLRLSDPDPAVVEAACWTLAKLGDTASAGRVEKVLAERSSAPSPLVARAHAQLSGRRAILGLRRWIDRHRTSRASEIMAAVASAYLELLVLEGAAVRPEVKAWGAAWSETTADNSIQTMTESYVAASVTQRQFRLFPGAVLERTGIRLVPGDWIEVRCGGAWGARGEPLSSCIDRVALPRDRFPEAPQLHLSGRIGTQRFRLEKGGAGKLVLVRSPGELILSCHLAYPIWLPTLPTEQLTGMAWVSVTRPCGDTVPPAR